MEKTEVAVVGAGPAGLLAAREAARLGVEVEVFEEHTVVGEPNHCAGVLSVEGLRRLRVEPSPRFIQSEIKGGRIFSPNGTMIEVIGNRTRAYVADRAAFDRHLAEEAEREGATIETQRRATGFILSDGRVCGVRGDGWQVQAGVVIDSEGFGGMLANSLGRIPKANGVLAGVNVEVSGVDVEPNVVEVWLGNDLAKGLFAWVIPLRDGDARLGIACSTSGAPEKLTRFLEKRFPGSQYSQPRRGIILTCGPIPKTYGDGVLVAGDAACQTKPTTGGGVVLGGLCAIEAGKTAAEAVDAGDFSSGFLKRYQNSWQGLLGGEFRTMLAARRLLNRLPDEQVDGLFEAFRREGLQESVQGLVDEGDVDLQSGVIRGALRSPRLLGAMMRVVGSLALTELRGLF